MGFEAVASRCLTRLGGATTATAVQSLAIVLATVGGVGYVPVAPGTAGSLAAVPLLPLLAAARARTPVGGWLAVAALLAVSVWAANRADETFPGHDHGRIVIDEVAGMIVAGLFVAGTWTAAAVAFVCFRFFDVVKPWPAGVIDRHVPKGIGVVGDDLVAGVYAGIAALILMEVL